MKLQRKNIVEMYRRMGPKDLEREIKELQEWKKKQSGNSNGMTVPASKIVLSSVKSEIPMEQSCENLVSNPQTMESCITH